MSVNNFLILFSGNKIANFMFFLYFHSNNRLKPKITTMRNDNIGKYLNDFERLMDTPFMNLDKIEWWLLKYADFHSEITTYYRDNNISYSPNSDLEAHPLYPLIINLHAFLDFYHFLNEITEYTRREAYFKEEIKEYQRIKASFYSTLKYPNSLSTKTLLSKPRFISSQAVSATREQEKHADKFKS